MASNSNGGDLETALLSEEQLDGRLSPELWPEPIPGVMEFAALLSFECDELWLKNRYPSEVKENLPRSVMMRGHCSFLLGKPPPNRSTKPKWALDEDGLVMLQELGSLTAAALLEKVKDLQNLAYKLGIEESREMTRGRFLDILRRDKDNRRK